MEIIIGHKITFHKNDQIRRSSNNSVANEPIQEGFWIDGKNRRRSLWKGLQRAPKTMFKVCHYLDQCLPPDLENLNYKVIKIS